MSLIFTNVICDEECHLRLSNMLKVSKCKVYLVTNCEFINKLWDEENMKFQ